MLHFKLIDNGKKNVCGLVIVNLQLDSPITNINIFGLGRKKYNILIIFREVLI